MQGIALARAVDLDSIRTFVEQSFALTYKFVEIGLRIPAIRADYYAIPNEGRRSFCPFSNSSVYSGMIFPSAFCTLW